MSSLDRVAPDDAPYAGLRDESRQVREALSALGRLLGAALAPEPRDLRDFVNRHLQVTSGLVADVASVLPGLDAALAHVAVARLLDAAEGAVLTDDLGSGSPGYELVTVDVGVTVAAPDDLAAYIPAGQGFSFDTVLVLTWERQQPRIALHVRRPDIACARAELSAFLSRAFTQDNFYRGKTLRVSGNGSCLEFTPVEPAAVRREDVVHTEKVWNEIDATIGGLTRHGHLLVAAGLGACRGLLVAGPPGVGKTALCRVIASELPAGTTILLADANLEESDLSRLYASLARLGPVAVILDDIDLMAGDRRHGTSTTALRTFLTELDGFTPTDTVVTIATTNDASAIDPALIRPGRFDSVVRIGPPAHQARVAILARYLRGLGEVDLDRLAAATNGATGADLREIVRRGVLEHGPALCTETMLEVVTTGRWVSRVPVGQYL